MRCLPPYPKENGFSLVEVTLALGIAVFAMLPMFALVPVGLDTFRNAADSTAIAQIVQSQIAQAQLQSFDTIDNLKTTGTTTCYDQEGLSTDSTTGNAIKATDFSCAYIAVATSGTISVPADNPNSAACQAVSDSMRLLTITISKPANPKDKKTFTSVISKLGI